MHFLPCWASGMPATTKMGTMLLFHSTQWANCSSKVLLPGLGDDTGSEYGLQGTPEQARSLMWEEVGQKDTCVRQEDGRTLLPSNTENLKRLEFDTEICRGCNISFYPPPPFMNSCIATWDSWVGSSTKHLNFSLPRRAWLVHQNMGIYMKEKCSKIFLKHQFKSRTVLPPQ